VLCTLAVCDPSICGHAAGVSINGCASFRASVEGAYGEQVAAAELQGRVGHFPAGGCSRSLMTMSDSPEGPKIEIGHQQSRTRASSGQCLATAQTRRPSATAGVLVNGSPDQGVMQSPGQGPAEGTGGLEPVPCEQRETRRRRSEPDTTALSARASSVGGTLGCDPQSRGSPVSHVVGDPLLERRPFRRPPISSSLDGAHCVHAE
jgi:hypothetical protein